MVAANYKNPPNLDDTNSYEHWNLKVITDLDTKKILSLVASCSEKSLIVAI